MMLGPVLLAQALSSCSLIDEPETIGDGSVNASLAFLVSVSSGEKKLTRMADAVVQEGENTYRGMNILSMTPFVINVETFANHEWKIVSTDVPLQQFTEANRVDDAGITETFFLYRNCDLDIGTNAFLVYGKPVAYSDKKAVNGSLLYMSKEGDVMVPLTDTDLATPNLQKLRFTLEPISSQSVPDDAELLAGYLTSIAQTTGWSSTADETLQDLFLSFTGQKNEENMMLAGSSANVIAHVNALYDVIKSETSTLNTDIIERIQSPDAILNIKLTSTGSGDSWKLTAIQKNADGNSYVNIEYPSSVGLPDGAAALRWVEQADHTYKFEPRIETTTQDNINNIGRFSYPAELFYYTNSQIDTSDSSVGEEPYKSATADWVGDVLPHYEYQPGIVTKGTKSVAIHEPLQYAVGRLKMTMKAETTTGKLKDSKGNDVTLTDTAFPLTGIIICNQHPVDFNFRPVLDNGAASHVDDRFIYDSQVKNGETSYCLTTSEETIQTIPSTLVLQTYDTGEGNDKKGAENVNIVMEFLNKSGQTFYGKSCVIYPETKFYLIGQIKPSEATSSSAPSEAKGRVFTQDYVTTINAKVGSLADAYNVLPDLIGGRLELGVELVSSWIQAETTNVILK